MSTIPSLTSTPPILNNAETMLINDDIHLAASDINNMCNDGFYEDLKISNDQNDVDIANINKLAV